MSPERLRVVTGLAGDGGWRADLALDRAARPARAVLLARVPLAMATDAMALATLARGIDLAARITHPAVRRVLGVAEASGDLVVLEGWREGETLEWLLRTGGPLSPPLVARIAVELAGALHAAHTLAAAGRTPLAHGDLRAERVLLTEDGSVLLCGLGRPTADVASPASDLRALARLLAECLPPGEPGSPSALGAVVERGLSPEGFGSAKALGEAVEAAVPPAALGALVARVEAVLPPGQPGWQARRSALAQALQLEAEDGIESVAPLQPPVEPPVRSSAGPGPSAHVAAPMAPTATTPPAMPVPKAATAPPPVSGSSPTHPASIMAQAGGPVAAPTSQGAAPASSAPAALLEVVANAELVEGGAAYIEVVPAPKSAALPPPPISPLDPWARWLADDRAPLLVSGVAGVVGLLLGLLVGKR